MAKAGFVEPMQALSATKLPTGPTWTYEVKLDGYRVEAMRINDRTALYTRRENSITTFPEVISAMSFLPEGTVIDGELAALDAEGRPSFNLLQNFRSRSSHVVFFAFDILFHEGRDLTGLPLSERRSLLRSVVEQSQHVSICKFATSQELMLAFVKEHGLEGVVAKRTDSRYEPGKRTGAWVKMRVTLAQELVIGGYTPSHLGIDALIVGFYRGKSLQFAGRVRAGFTPLVRRSVFEQIRHLETSRCPFVNLPDKSAGAWGQGLTAEKMKECTWLKPEAVVQIEFLEWTPGDRLRHASFVALRDDKDPRTIVKET